MNMSIKKILFSAFVVVNLLFYTSSCKRSESCHKDITYEWNSDTLLIPYSGNERLKFIIVDSTGTLLDSAEYIGNGTSKRILDGENVYQGCSDGIFYFHPVKDWVYYNKISPKDKLYISVIVDDISSTILISLTENINSFNQPKSYQNFGSSIRYNHQAVKDTVILGKSYINLVPLGTPPQERVNGVMLLSLFNRTIGIVSIEENPNRFWIISD